MDNAWHIINKKISNHLWNEVYSKTITCESTGEENVYKEVQMKIYSPVEIEISEQILRQARNILLEDFDRIPRESFHR